MEASVSRFWCRKGYTGITIFGHIFTRTQEDADKFNSKFDALKNHEMIHVRQAQSLYDSWFLFYVRYLWFSLMAVGYVRRMKGAMYYLNPFEMEAYGSYVAGCTHAIREEVQYCALTANFCELTLKMNIFANAFFWRVRFFLLSLHYD